ncbi:MAG TPA: hypothetical protein VMV87_03405 [Burkholderiales bacterium]|nr:hypothetical protein [Burkholderiales bacterium]
MAGNDHAYYEAVLLGPRRDEAPTLLDGDRFVVSDDGHLYSEQALRKAPPLFWQVPLRTTHHWFGQDGYERPIQIGHVHEAWFVEAACELRAIIAITTEDARRYLGSLVLRRAVESCGLSIDATVEALPLSTRLEIVTRIVKVSSVDLAQKPLTGARLLGCLEPGSW